jgi:predicted dehydrogenase
MIRVGIVGASLKTSWAAAAHLPALAHLDEFTVTAVATTRQASADEAAAAFGARHAFIHAADLAGHPDVDLVVVSVKPPEHASVVRAAIAAGKHIYCEWPLGTDLGQTAELAGAAASAGRVHAIGLQGYRSPAARFVKDFLDGGGLGRVESASIIAPGDPWGGSRIPASLAWGTDPAAGAGVLTVMVGHTVAALENLLGRLTQISAVTANLHDKVTVAETGEPVDNATPGQIAMVGRVASGALATLAVHGGNSTAGPDGFIIRVAGTDGTLTITPTETGLYVGWADWTIRLRTTDGSTTQLAVPRRYRTVLDVPAGPAANIAALYREIGAAITQGRPAHPDFGTALHHHRVLEAIERAEATGTRQLIS